MGLSRKAIVMTTLGFALACTGEAVHSEAAPRPASGSVQLAAQDEPDQLRRGRPGDLYGLPGSAGAQSYGRKGDAAPREPAAPSEAAPPSGATQPAPGPDTTTPPTPQEERKALEQEKRISAAEERGGSLGSSGIARQYDLSRRPGGSAGGSPGGTSGSGGSGDWDDWDKADQGTSGESSASGTSPDVGGSEAFPRNRTAGGMDMTGSGQEHRMGLPGQTDPTGATGPGQPGTSGTAGPKGSGSGDASGPGGSGGGAGGGGSLILAAGGQDSSSGGYGGSGYGSTPVAPEYGAGDSGPGKSETDRGYGSRTDMGTDEPAKSGSGAATPPDARKAPDAGLPGGKERREDAPRQLAQGAGATPESATRPKTGRSDELMRRAVESGRPQSGGSVGTERESGGTPSGDSGTSGSSQSGWTAQQPGERTMPPSEMMRPEKGGPGEATGAPGDANKRRPGPANVDGDKNRGGQILAASQGAEAGRTGDNAQDIKGLGNSGSVPGWGGPSSSGTTDATGQAWTASPPASGVEQGLGTTSDPDRPGQQAPGGLSNQPPFSGTGPLGSPRVFESGPVQESRPERLPPEGVWQPDKTGPGGTGPGRTGPGKTAPGGTEKSDGMILAAVQSGGQSSGQPGGETGAGPGETMWRSGQTGSSRDVIVPETETQRKADAPTPGSTVGSGSGGAPGQGGLDMGSPADQPTKQPMRGQGREEQ